jgi:hypothetical protein
MGCAASRSRITREEDAGMVKTAEPPLLDVEVIYEADVDDLRPE